ncbi:MAG: crotonyl-CoA carboxylase/reductase, partial [Actinomycetales bacterium]
MGVRTMQPLVDAIVSGAESAAIAALPLPETYLGVTVHKEDEGMFEGLPTNQKDPRESMHLDEVPVPELAPGEALIAVMATSINYNKV